MKCQGLFSGKNKKNIINLSSAELVMVNACYFRISSALTLKTARKPASENVVYLRRLLNILANFSNLFLCIQPNSVDPDQTTPLEAV